VIPFEVALPGDAVHRREFWIASECKIRVTYPVCVRRIEWVGPGRLVRLLNGALEVIMQAQVDAPCTLDLRSPVRFDPELVLQPSTVLTAHFRTSTVGTIGKSYGRLLAYEAMRR
jgi:hypothetical protein